MDVDHCVVVGEAEVMTVFVASSVVTIRGLASMMTVRVEVEVRPLSSVAT
jgi:hypothetical protein